MRTQKLLVSRTSVRKFLLMQLVLIAMALGIRAFFWATQSPAPTLVMVASVLIVGNLANLLFALAQPLFVQLPRAWNLPVQIISLVVFGISSGLLTLIAMAHHYGRHFSWTGPETRLSVFLILAVNLLLFGAIYIYSRMKDRLETRNFELEREVQFGHVQQQAQEAELARAHEIQEHLLPRETPQLAGFQIACAWQPAKAVSGDYFDVFPVSDGQMGLCLADVSGKGVSAALLMANLQASVKAFAGTASSPAALCAKLNGILCGTIAPGKFVTFFYGVLDGKTQRLHYENAGHCLPLLVRADGSIAMPASYSGVLGLFSHWTYQDSELQLQPGDCLLLLTDGILEAADAREEEFGYQRLIDIVQRNRTEGAHALRKKILEDVSRFCNGVFQDDASLILVTVD